MAPNPPSRISVDSATLKNNGSTKVTLTYNITQSKTETKTFGGSISVSLEAGFWGFAQASATVTASVSVTNSMTWTTSQGVNVPVAAGDKATVDFGFNKYDQYIKMWYWTSAGSGHCSKNVTAEGWVRAPYEKTFKVS